MGTPLKNQLRLAYRYRSFAVAARLGVVRCNGRVFIIIDGPQVY